MTGPAITIDDVVVSYRPYTDRNPTLKRALAQRRLRSSVTVTALDQVSFSVEKGEAFGVIGANGAGKSTLLRVLAGTLKPDEGSVHVDGHISPLLALGLGFNRQLSGLRNIYLGGLAGGLRRAEIDQKVDSIVTYSGIGDAVFRPVKTYSSGMFARLAFSVAMAMEPDILLLDEVLAVGDREFHDQSMETMQALLARSGTIVFVSHALAQVKSFCDRALWLEQGEVRALGPAEDVVAAYEAAGGRRRKQ